MGYRDNAPVKETCPLIDSVISFIDSMQGMVSSEDEKEFKIESKHALDTLEKIRTANSKLREWGNEKHTEVDKLEDEKNDLESKLDRLRDQITDLNKELANTQRELEDKIDELDRMPS